MCGRCGAGVYDAKQNDEEEEEEEEEQNGEATVNKTDAGCSQRAKIGGQKNITLSTHVFEVHKYRDTWAAIAIVSV